jgi:cephalosporin hydroxylase
MDEFEERNADFMRQMTHDRDLARLSREWYSRASRYEYSYHFTWLGRPVIQFPQDLLAVQEIVWKVQPDLIIETGIARGGSLIFSASLLELLGNDGRVVGIDVDIRPHNRAEIERHPMAKRITMIEGSSVADHVVAKVRDIASLSTRALVLLDSNHSMEHVGRELELYGPLVTPGSYLVAFDTIIGCMPEGFSQGRPWGPKDNPLVAVQRFLEGNPEFEIDQEIDSKLLITSAPGGYLRRKSR